MPEIRIIYSAKQTHPGPWWSVVGLGGKTQRCDLEECAEKKNNDRKVT